MSTSTLAVAVAAFVAVAGPLTTPPIPAQYVAPGRYFEPGTTWEKHTDWGAGCVWSGREPDGAGVYGWETQSTCPGQIYAWGYDFDGDASVELYLWPRQIANCGVQIQAWQWVVNGQWTEYVTGSCVFSPTANQWQFMYTYFSAANGTTCNAGLSFFDLRNRAAYTAFLTAQRTPGTNRLSIKWLWHNYNQTNLTLHACRAQLAGGRPDN